MIRTERRLGDFIWDICIDRPCNSDLHWPLLDERDISHAARKAQDLYREIGARGNAQALCLGDGLGRTGCRSIREYTHARTSSESNENNNAVGKQLAHGVTLMNRL